VHPDTGFAEGWMCLLHKKNDKRNVSNYRPITLLNTDYKIFTKALAIKLAETVPSIIHKDQAGFIPGRSIVDQIKLVESIINHAEHESEGGAVVALDQEKAYDKIRHDYLWRTMERANFPNHFTKIIRSLYENAYTSVMVNGEKSTRYRVTRGVRQGDPISCLLFNLAIEPLAQMIRASDLKGYKCPGRMDRIIAALFADDTTVCLSKEDRFEDLEEILSTWCKASGAKFNKGKTQIIPIGPLAYREEVLRDRKLNPTHPELPQHIAISKEGEAIRILGSWQGNVTDQPSIWAPTIEKIERSLAHWDKQNPTIKGRKMVVQMTVGGMSQYLTAVQGMPKDVEEYLDKRIKNFIWAGK
jgi:hypothetical protein